MGNAAVATFPHVVLDGMPLCCTGSCMVLVMGDRTYNQDENV